MADVLLSIEEASKQLQLSKDQITEMVKKGLLRGFLDQKTYKFRPADVEAFKKKLASGITTTPKTDAVPGGTQPRKDATSKIDLTEVESDAAVEDTDQTSVLAPVEPGEPKDKQPEKPVFKFGEKDRDLHEEELPVPAEGDQTSLVEGDQTSLLVPGSGKEEKGKEDGKPAFHFAEKDVKSPPGGEAGDSVLVADESESSMDILEVAEESSSESPSSASRIVFSDEATSGEEIKVAAGTPSQLGQKPAPKAGESPTDKVVTDILGPAPEDSDEALETLDVDEVVETKEAAGTEARVKPETAATAPVGSEYETVGLPSAEETKVAGGEAAAAAETAGVDGAVAAALQEQAAEEEPQEPEEAEEAAPGVIPTGWETAQGWAVGNGLLIAATVVLVVSGALIFCEAFNVHNGFTASIAEAVRAHLH